MFIAVVAQAGVEATLKSTLQINTKDTGSWRAAFQRPGFVTFKSEQALAEDVVVPSVLARAWFISHGRASSFDELCNKLNELLQRHVPNRVHVFCRDQFAVDESPAPRELFARSLQLESELATRLPRLSELYGKAMANDLVLSVCEVDPSQWWLGLHRHTPAHSPYPGGRPRLSLPEQAPSRAYLKAEEAIGWAGIQLDSNTTVLELGSAPGGAVWAFLQHQARVVGIDPGAMAPQVLAHPRYSHVNAAVADVTDDAWPNRCDYLFVDLNLAPIKSLHAIERALPHIKRHLRGMIVTFKIHGEKQLADLPSLMARLGSFGFSNLRARQLGFNRREICVVAMR